jgi:hypothetical protein
MLICQHRVNTAESLRNTPREFGVEVDIRSRGNDLYIAHDPFVEGPLFEEWLMDFDHEFLIANVKEEGLEHRLSNLFSARNIENWAFLDQSFPFLVKGLKRGHTKTMVRLSEYESVQTAISLSPQPDWIWLDSFEGKYPKPDVISSLAKRGFKFMLVSPELQARVPEAEISHVKAVFADAAVPIHGVCTKEPGLWLA